MKFLMPFLGFLWLIRLLDRLTEPGSCERYRRTEEGLPRQVISPGLEWAVFQDECGDVNVLPVGEEADHSRDGGCACVPRVDVEGASLVIVHNAFDHREIVEQAVDIMNGVES